MEIKRKQVKGFFSESTYSVLLNGIEFSIFLPLLEKKNKKKKRIRKRLTLSDHPLICFPCREVRLLHC